MIRKCDIEKDFPSIYEIINDSAAAYRGLIPDDQWQEPYMPGEELRKQIDEGVEFWCFIENDEISGVMGIQFKEDVTLIRHAYVRTSLRRKGIGSKLLKHLAEIAESPILIGTWAEASWAIEFYKNHGFKVLSEKEKNKLLRKYWSIPERQVETSIVLANLQWYRSSCIVFFDGYCNFCSATVDWVWKRNQSETLYFSPLQSDFARDFLADKGITTVDMNTIYFSERGIVRKRSGAVFRIMTYFTGIWRITGTVLSLLPAALTDPVYRLIANFRHKLMGSRTNCRVPTPQEEVRFLE